MWGLRVQVSEELGRAFRLLCLFQFFLSNLYRIVIHARHTVHRVTPPGKRFLLLARALTWSRTLSILRTAPPQLLHRRLRNHIVVYIFVRSFVQPRSGLRNHRVLIATPHQEEQCPLNLQYGLACRGFCRSNCLCWYPIRQKRTLPIASSPHALRPPTVSTPRLAFSTRFGLLIPISGAELSAATRPLCP
jgi:hypothetical protein